MARRILQALRSAIHPAARVQQRKTIVAADYYAALSAAGVYSAHKAKPWPVDRAVLEAFERSVYVFKSVQTIAGHGAARQFRLRQGEDVLDDHPLYRVLNVKANPLETGAQFKKRVGAQVLLSKKGVFIEATTARNGDVLRMDLLPPGRTTPIPEDRDNPESLIKYFEVQRVSGGVRKIEPEKVRWLRDPHPLDPYSGITPLEAAGMSIELDVFSRWYNVNFLRNDARPGGVVAIDGELGEADVEKVEDLFEGGPIGAGALAVIAGKVSYIDLSARPRDMQYAVTSRTAKEEILTVFGVGESVIGNASGRTFDNADQEFFNFWTITMPPFLDIMVTGFDGDSEDGLEGFFDLDDIEVLQRPKIARREEARKEWEAGLITANEYREEAGLPPFDRPEARALFIPAGRTPIPADEQDAIAMGLGPPELEAGQEERGAIEAAQQPGQELPGGPERPAIEPPAPAAVTPVQADLLEGIKSRDELHGEIQVKQAPPPAPQIEIVESEPNPTVTAHLEAVLAAALTTVAARLLPRTEARLLSPKTRRGTRHWRAETKADTRGGDAVIDAAEVVEVTRWQEEAEAAVAMVAASAAVLAAAELYADLGEAPPADGERLVRTAVEDAVALVGVLAALQAQRLVEIIATADQQGLSLPEIAGLLAGQSVKLSAWAASVAIQVASAIINGARDAAAEDLADGGDWSIVRQWRSRRDDKVRWTHRKAHGQIQPLGETFEVGTALLRYPGDPLGPPGEVRNCRCVLIHRSTTTGRFVAAPPGQITRRAS